MGFKFLRDPYDFQKQTPHLYLVEILPLNAESGPALGLLFRVISDHTPPHRDGMHTPNSLSPCGSCSYAQIMIPETKPLDCPFIFFWRVFM